MRWLCFISLLTMTSVACGCKNKGNSTGTGSTPGFDGDALAACEARRDQVYALYLAAAKAPAGETEAARDLRVQEASDNTTMVLIDCRTSPTRFVPCLQRAASVAQMERDCLAPLDDEGSVEGKHFSAMPPRANQ